MAKLHVDPAPHIHSGLTTQKVMLDVVIALIPSAIVAVVLFKLAALWLILTCVATAVLCEFLFNLIVRKKQTVSDLSAVVTGLILALNLSTNVKLWQAAVGSVFAIVIVKCLFGGLGKNIVNPAIGARVFLLLTFATVAGGANPDLSTGATPLAVLKNGLEGAPSIMNLFLGNVGGTIGETCAIAILLGYAYLVIRKQIKWYVPVAFVGTVFVCYLIYSQSIVMAVSQVLAGGLLFGAVFMATDYVTTPISNTGKVVFCVGCGLITFAIRAFGSYPEGVSISILCMNLLTPLIEKVTQPRTLGGIK